MQQTQLNTMRPNEAVPKINKHLNWFALGAIAPRGRRWVTLARSWSIAACLPAFVGSLAFAQPIHDPSELSGLALWQDAGSLSLLDGASVSTWPGRGGMAYGASQTNVLLQPTFHTGAINGLPAVHFGGDAANQSLHILLSATNQATYGDLGIGSNGITYFAVIRATQATDGILVGDSDNICPFTASTTRIGLGRHNFGGAVSVPGDYTSFVRVAGIMSDIDPNATNDTTAYVNGVASPTTSQLNSSLPVAGLALNIGADVTDNTNRQHFGGDLAELIIYNRRLNATELLQVDAYLQSKYQSPQCVTPPSGLVSWWPGDGNATDIQRGNNGTLENGASFVTGEVGSAFSFDGAFPAGGSNAVVVVPDSPALRFGTNDLTVECWIKCPSVTSWPANGPSVLGKASSSYPYQAMFLRIEDPGLSQPGRLDFAVADCTTPPCDWGASRYPVVSPSRIDDDQWHHVAGVRIATGYELYVDGQRVATRSEPARNADTSGPLLIGALILLNDGAVQYPFQGQVDEVAIYGRALSSNEIASVYAAGSAGKCKPQCVTPPSGLVSWWSMNGDLSDVMGANPPSSSYNVSFVAGKVSGGATFGTNGYIEVADSPSLANQRFTFEAWVRPDGPGPNNDIAGSVILIKATSGTFAYGLAWLATESRFLFECGDWYGGSKLLSPPHAAGSFYHVVGTYDGSAFSLYVNGVVEGQLPATVSLSYTSSIPWSVGADPGIFRNVGYPRTWNGVIDEVSIYNRALSSNEIAAIYAAGSAGKCKGAVPMITWTNPAPITFGTALSSNQLNATANVPGSFAYTPTNGTVLSAGTNTLSVIFTPTDAVDYTTATDSVSLVVLPVAGPTNLVLDGGFEESTNLAPFWSVVGFNPAFAYPQLLVYPPYANTGSNSVAVGGDDNGQFNGISQTLSTTPGATYEVRVWLENNNAPLDPWSVTFGGTPILAGTLPGVFETYLLFHTNVIANSSSTILTIGASGRGPIQVDDVSVTELQTPPTITTQPLSQTVAAGSNVTFAVGATGSQPLSYQWQFNGTNLTDNARVTGSQSNSITIASLLASDAGNYQVMAINAYGRTNSTVATLTVSLPYTFVTLAGLAGNAGANDGTGSTARFSSPYGVAVDAIGNVYVADQQNETIRKVAPAGVVTSLAGLAGSIGSTDGTGSVARFYYPSGVALDSAGNIYVGDTYNHTIRKVTPTGVVTTLAGLAGNLGSADGTGNAARFNQPVGVAVDTNGNICVADALNHTIRQITPAGVVTTLAGVAGTTGSADGTGSVARFNFPMGVAVDSADNVYVADRYNHTIRKMTPAGTNWVVTTLAGLAGSTGSADGTGSAARFYYPLGVAVDTNGNVYVGDRNSDTIRKVTSAGEVTTLGGLSIFDGGLLGSADGTGTAARFYFPDGVAVDSAGNVYVADEGNSTIRKGYPPLPPVIVSQPQSLSVNLGASATFAVTASGAPPLGYQWQFEGTNLADNSRISGSSSNTLAVANVLLSDAGNYQVVVTNTYGSATSVVAVLSVLACVPPPSGLVSWWPGDGNANDIQGGNHGALSNGATFATGLVGQAFSFDGVKAFVSVPDNPVLSPHAGTNGEMTVEAWVNLPQYPVNLGNEWKSPVVVKGDIGKWEYFLYVYPDRRVGFKLWNFELGVDAAVAAGGMITTNQWHHLLGTVKKGEFLRVYLDGVQVAETTTFLYDTQHGSAPLLIGGIPVLGEFFNGLVDEVGLYNRALSSNEVAAIYTAGSAGKCKSTVLAAMLVASYSEGSVLRYDDVTGAYLGTFVAPHLGGLQAAEGLAFGRDGNLYVTDVLGNKILRYQGQSGGFLGTFTTNGLSSPGALALGPDGNLYVVNAGANNIVVLDGLTGAVIRQFGAAVLQGPYGLTFGPDGSLFIADWKAGVMHFDPASGSFLGVFCPPGNFGSPPVGGAGDPAFGPDGNLYVTDIANNRVLRFNGVTGAPLGDAITGGGLAGPNGLAFGPDGNLYVVSGGMKVLRYNGATGSFIDQFTTNDFGGTYAGLYKVLFTRSWNLLKNGSFEFPALAANSYAPTNPAFWSQTYLVNGHPNDVGFTSQAEDGQQYVDIGNSPPSALSQTFSVTRQGTYVLRWFDNTGNIWWYPGPSPYSVAILDAANQEVASANFNAKHLPILTWASNSMYVSLSPATYTLWFRPQGPPGGLDSLIDNVSLEAVGSIQLGTVTLQVNPTNAGYASGGGIFELGSSVSVIASAETNALPFTFLNWTEGGAMQSTNSTYTFTLQGNRALVANFVLPTFQLAASNNPPVAGTVTGTGMLSYGSTNILSANANFGYRFADWTENGSIIETNPILTIVVFRNRFLVANYDDANVLHTVTVATQPPGLASIPGAGVYGNGQSVTLSAPVLLTNEPNYYTFRAWTLNGTNYTMGTDVTKTLATTDATNLNFVAQYDSRSIRPLLLVASPNLSPPVPATTNFVVTLRFDRSMRSWPEPLLVLTNAAAAMQASVPTGGVWITTALSNDTFRTPPITFVSGMDGTNQLFASLAQDLAGAELGLTNALNVLVDATAPAITDVSASPTAFSAFVAWATDEPATSLVEFGLTDAYGTTAPPDTSLVTNHSVILTGLIPGTSYHFRVHSRDLAGNEAASGDGTFTTSLAPDLQVTGILVLPETNLQSGSQVTVIWTNSNTGLGTTTGSWYDQLVVSNVTIGQVVLATNVYFDVSLRGNIAGGQLDVNQCQFRLPDGPPGAGGLTFIITADINNNVLEYNALGTAESNNTAQTTRVSQQPDYPDLRVENLAVTDPGTGNLVTVSWTIANRGAATAPAGFVNQLLVQNQSSGTTLRNMEFPVTQPLAAGASTSGVATITAIPPGSWLVQVTADSKSQVYEWADCGHDCAEQNSVITNFQILQFWQVSAQPSPPDGGSTTGSGRYQAGASVTVTATPNTNVVPYFFANWTEAGAPQSTSSSYTFTATRDRQLLAVFDLPAYQIAASNNPPSAGTVSGAGSFKYASTNYLSALANFGYRFTGWTENGLLLSTNATLATVVYSSRLFVANYAEANLFHVVNVSTLPGNLTNIPGSGTYSNGDTLTFSAPLLITQEPNYYTFQRWMLNYSLFGTNGSFTKTFSTTDPTNLNFLGVYSAKSILPLVISATGNLRSCEKIGIRENSPTQVVDYQRAHFQLLSVSPIFSQLLSAPVPATTNFVVTLQFDRAMQTGAEPVLTFTNTAALLQASVPTGGVWLTTTFTNDTYRTPPTTFIPGMDGTNHLSASQAADQTGMQLAVTNCLDVIVDATPPTISNIAATRTPLAATITWSTDEPATSQVEYGATAAYGSSSPFASTLVTSHSVPLGGLVPGNTYHFRVHSRDLAGNEAVSGDGTFTTTLAPDLQVTGINILPQGNIQSGVQITAVWTDSNLGLGPTTGSWLDQLVVSNLTTGRPILATTIYYDSAALGNITNGDSRTRQFTLRLPDGLAGVGQLLFAVTVDANNAVAEYNALGTAENNNASTATATSTLGPYPDLLVSGISMPATAVPGQPLQVSWTVTNQGNATATGPWTDTLYLSDDRVFGNDQPVASFTYAAALDPGQSLVETQAVVLPSGITGNRFLIVYTDSGNRVFEVIKTNNVAIAATPIQFLNPDLVVDSVATLSNAKFGDVISVVWTVRNAGTAPAIGGWTDRISLSTNPGSLANSTTLLTVPAAGLSPLAVGATYTQTQMVTLPLGASFAPANYFLQITTDSGNTLFELSETNNTTASASISLSLPQLPDLVVDSISSPTNGFAGQPVTLVWTVTNQGPAAAVGPWTDSVLLSQDASGSSAQPVASFTYSNLLNPGDSLTRTGLVTLPSSVFGQMFFAVYVNSSNDVFEGAAQGNNLAVASSPTLVQTPDLLVTSLQAPLEVLTDQGFYVTWSTTNQTAAPADGSWTDNVYLSPDGQPGNGLLLGSFSFTGTLLGNQSMTRIQSVSIPRNSVTNGYYHLVVITDYGNTLNEGTNNFNNTFVDQDLIHVTRNPLPDLVVQSVEAPGTAFSGQTITVRWTVQNIGNASTDAALWNDQVWLSTSTAPGGSWGNEFQNVSYLATNESYVGSADLRIPITAFGTYYIVVRTDSRNAVREENEQNNVANAVIEVELTPPPDLQVTSVQAPGESFSGQPIPVSWTVANLGPGPVLAGTSSWMDNVLLSRTNVLDSSAVLLYSQRHYGVLLTNQFYSVQNQSVTLPRNIFGNYYVFVLTDAGNEVFEYGYENNNSNYDPTPVHITLTPPPDLVVEASAPTNGTAGQPLTASWYVLNQGAGDTVVSLWYDSVYVSANSTFDSSATLVGNVYHSGLLAAGGRYAASTTYTPSVCGSGPLYFYVMVDSYNNVQEFDPSYNAEGNNLARTSLPTSIAPVGVPDLQVIWVGAPQVGDAGKSIQVSWVVTNSGNATAPAVGWTDRAYLSLSPDFNLGGGWPILDLQHAGEVTVGATYTNTAKASVPSWISGFCYVFVMADANNVVAECAGENNNLKRSAGATYINPAPPPPPPPHLQVDSVTAPSTAISGQNIMVSWIVNNVGAGDAAGTWQDSVYLLPSANSAAGAIYIGSISESGTLPAGSNRQSSGTFTLPYRLSGGYYVMAWTDSANQLGEGSNQNDNSSVSATPLSVTQAPLPDLQVTSVGAPSYALEGQSITVNWTVVNAGIGPTVTASWSDYVYLSRDQILDPTDLFLGYASHNGILANTENYSQSLSVQLPRGISGQYYVFVLSDARGAVLELTEDNKYAYTADPVQVNLQPLSDLTVTSVSLPASGSPGQPATFVWTVANQGANAASGSWVDSVYISSNQVWDITAPLVGKVPHNGPLQPGQSFTASLTATLPAVTPGQYYAIVRADILNSVRESDENNNAGVSVQTMTADVVELTLGQPYPSQLNNGTEQYYKVAVPSNQVMSVTLDATETNGFNELFTSFGAMPNRGEYDFLYGLPWEPDQQIVVPQTQAGYYYHLARGEYVPQPPASYTIKAELVPFSITSVSPSHIGDKGQVTITIHGALFQDGAAVQLVNGTNVLVASKVTVVDAATAKARFYFTNAFNGLYDVVLTNPGLEVATSTHALQVEPALPLAVSTAMTGNQRPRAGQPTGFSCAARNTANIDAPYLVVQVSVQGSTPWDLRRTANTFPKNCMQCTPNALDSVTDQFTTASGGFLARGVEPGQELVFLVTVEHVTAATTVAFGATTRSVEALASELGVVTENLRQECLTNGGIQLPPPLSDVLGDAAAWRSVFVTQFLTFGLIDDSEVNAFLYPTTTQMKERSLKTADPVDPCGCNEVFKECEINHLDIAKSCLAGCLPSLPFGLYPACLWKCGIEEYLIHWICEVPKHICDLSCKRFTCLSAIADGDVSGGDVCPQASRDPNEIQGPAGYGPMAYVKGNSVLPYVIYFENVTNAVATARQIQIINQLHPNVDPRTLRIQEISLGNYRITVPQNQSFYQARVQLGTNFNNLLADISAGVDIQNSQVVWTLTAIDPSTGEQPQSALSGLLPPNDTNHVGEGYVTYTVQPFAGTPTGAVITNKATIVFDSNEPIDTNPWWNTVDAGAPTSLVAALPSVSTNSTFTVSWFGADDPGGSGVNSYDIFVAEDGRPYQAWQTGVTSTSATFSATPGHTYAFYSVATDNVGNREADHFTPDTVTLVGGNQPPVLAPIADRVVDVGATLTITNTANDPDLPAQSLTFSLGPNAPVGTSINPTNGIFRWRPTPDQASSSNLITVLVTDDGVPSMSATQSFTVVVSDYVQSVLGSFVIQSGGNGSVPLRFVSSVPLASLCFTVDFPANYFTNFALTNIAAQITNASITSPSSTQLLICLSNTPGQNLIGTQQLAQLTFSAVTNQLSSFVWLKMSDFHANAGNGASVSNVVVQGGRLVVVGRQPLLEGHLSDQQDRSLVLYGQPSMRYAIEFATNVVNVPQWTLFQQVDLVGTSELLDPLPDFGSVVLYRAREVGDTRAVLSLQSSNGTLVIDWPSECLGCVLEETSTPGLSNTWSRSQFQGQLNGNIYQVTIPIAQGNRFYRLRRP